MKTPIFDAVKRYSESGTVRAHMPGHKGKGPLGIEKYDLTEIDGLDVLYSASGIIEESENNASELFSSAHSYYSTEGSTLAIKAMLAIALYSRKSDTPPTVLAARNVHKAFISAAALLDFQPVWLSGDTEHICTTHVRADEVRRALADMENKPAAVYVTSPDYLGNTLDIEGIASVCEEFSVPLLVDNAHGAYLAFLDDSQHPITKGAAMCADSAHKTLPVLTGGAYLHISKKYSYLKKWARGALSLFASTSPSYLIMSSLDLANEYIANGYKDRLSSFVKKVDAIKVKHSLPLNTEPLKILLCGDYSLELRASGIECEFADGDYTVLMLTPENEQDLDKIDESLSRLDLKRAHASDNVEIPTPVCVMSVREATLSDFEEIDVRDAEGRICATLTVSCPPAVPIAVSGERITHGHIALFERYGVEKIKVVK